MKKIKNINQLKDDRKQLKLRSQYLELKISNDWKELREDLRPVNIAMDTIGSIFKNKAESNEHTSAFLKNAVNFSVNLLTKKLVNMAGEKLKKVFKKEGNKKD